PAARALTAAPPVPPDEIEEWHWAKIPLHYVDVTAVARMLGVPLMPSGDLRRDPGAESAGSGGAAAAPARGPATGSGVPGPAATSVPEMLRERYRPSYGLDGDGPIAGGGLPMFGVRA